MRRAGALATAVLLTVYFVFALLVLVLRYAVLPQIDHYRPELEALASRSIHQKVTIGAVSADWVGLRPRLKLTDLTVFDAEDRAALRLPKVEATLAWETLTVFTLHLHSLRVTSPELDIRRDAVGMIWVGGIAVDPKDDSGDTGLLPWALEQTEIAVTGAKVHWTDALRGAPPFDLAEVNFELNRSGTRHRFAFSGQPPAVLAAPFELRGYVQHSLFATNANAEHWSGEIYANFAYVDLAGWHAYFDYPFDLTRGAGALRSWIRFSENGTHGGRQGRLWNVVADVRLSNLEARVRQDLPPLVLLAVNGRVNLEQSAYADRLTLHGFSVHGADGLDLPATDLDAHRTLDLQGHQSDASIATGHLDLRTLSELGGRMALPPDVQTVLARYRPRGVLKDLHLNWHGTLEAPKSYQISSRFDGLGVAAAIPSGTDPDRPGFANLSGQIEADQSGGSINIQAQSAALTLPGLLAEPEIPLDRIEVLARWTLLGENLEIHLNTLNFENADAAGSASGSYRRGPASTSQGPGFLDLTARLTRADGTRVARYLPLSMPEEVRSYVGRAILAGTSDDVSFRVRGALERFPFRQTGAGAPPARAALPGGAHVVRVAAGSNEEFHIQARLHGVKLDYAPRPVSSPGSSPGAIPGSGSPPGSTSAEPLWPPLEDLEADLSLDRTRMEIVGHSARAFGFKLEKIHAEFPDLDDHNQVLSVHGTGQGPLADLFRFVNSSPVEGWIDHVTTGMRASGAAHLELTLALPLAHGDQTRVTGAIQFQNNDITLFPWLPALGRATGELDFSDQGMGLKNVQAQFLGGPVKIDSTAGEDHFIQVRAEGTAQAAGLRREQALPTLAKFAERLDGQAGYQVTLNIAPHSADDRVIAAHGPKLLIESSLSGLAIDLPAPLRKNAGEAMPLRVEFDAPRQVKDEVTDQVRARIGSAVGAVFARRQNATGEMDVVHAAYGINEPATLTDARAFANISLPALDLDAWQDVLGSLAGVNLGAALNAPPSVETSLVPDSISARVQSLHVNEKTFGNVVLNATHSGATWQANVNADEVAGQISWRQGGVAGAQQNRITARLTKLIVPRSAAKEVSTLLETGPTSLPALDITADDFELRDKKLGRLELVASNTARAGHRDWHMDKLNLTNPDGALQASGTWGSDGEGTTLAERTRMSFTLSATDIGKLLDRLGLKGTVKGGTATLKGDVDWQGSPLSIDYDTLSGTLNVAASRGQFLKAEPGVAKLLGVLSLQSLTRRLTLDFTDLFAGGFAFDSIDADATVEEGVASTHNFSMRGVSANVSIDGSADLAHETQNLHVRVLPQVNLGTGSIAYALLVNPVIGLGTLAIGEVLRDPISKALAFEYNISGPWADPSIVRVDKTGLAPSAPAVPALPTTPLPATPTPASEPATSG